ncbi:MAG TPA: uroporphyrinogen decarboxylase family protein [Candidatus Deferrimicrobium sp.]|nr:uroporphyrinogen decarboxylase family protein [Candidatus Deferrimicrobium sp.]
MEKKERVLTALNLEEPDQVPTHVIYLDANNVDNVMGKPEQNDFEMMKELQEEYPDDWLEQINQIIEEMEVSIFSRMVESVFTLSLDTTQVGIVPLEIINEHEMKDIFGRIWEAQNNAGNIYPFYKYGTVNSLEKWEWIQQDLEERATEKYCKMAKKFYKRINKKFKESNLIMVTNDLAGIFESTWQGMGMEFFVKQLYTNRDFIARVFNTYTDFTIAWYNSYMDAGAEVFVESGDLAFKTGTFMSPKLFDELLLPCYKRLTDAVHSRGGKIILHSDGHITPLLDFIVNCGFDGLHSLEPTAGVDLALVKKKVGHKLCLLGNIDTGQVLTKGTQAEVEAAVQFAIKTAGPGGGFILSAANMHPAINVQNLRWMVEAVHKFGRYPLSSDVK